MKAAAGLSATPTQSTTASNLTIPVFFTLPGAPVLFTSPGASFTNILPVLISQNVNGRLPPLYC